MLLRLACLTVTNLFAAPRLLPMSDREKNTEILALHRQLTVMERQLGPDRIKFTPEDRAFLAALLIPLLRKVLRRLRLLILTEQDAWEIASAVKLLGRFNSRMAMVRHELGRKQLVDSSKAHRPFPGPDEAK
ncbi:hypothetical protein ACFVXC_00130 [Streptomyces sp. NPDC058257]|uniref:hypothetical protein n=1 Tax=Streptomyces sp. NPDC058257 TaxID=3346409 RepID=UPI0036EB22C3